MAKLNLSERTLKPGPDLIAAALDMGGLKLYKVENNQANTGKSPALVLAQCISKILSDQEGVERFKVELSKRANPVELWYVYDSALQIEVFHWYGATAHEKCEVVALSLNALNHGKD